MKRQIVRIDENKCTGCEECIPNCPEGAIPVIDGKARLISDLMCDGLGACLGHCPEGAITIEEREAEPYDERKVMVNIAKAGTNTIKAHLTHLREHGQNEYLTQALGYLKDNHIEIPEEGTMHAQPSSGCPGSRAMTFGRKPETSVAGADPQPSALTHWPVQMHLISPGAPQYRSADVVLAADCVAYALGDFHSRYLAGKALTIACPKLDAKINTLTVVIMQVPCCSGLLRLAQKATEQASRKIPIKAVVIGIQGEVQSEEWA
jgi:Pyruvate/2-oxoacid:ferredoxin oxidoreductase delta subunit